MNLILMIFGALRMEKNRAMHHDFEGTDHEEQERLFVFYSQELEKPKIDAERELLFEYLPASPDRRSGCGRFLQKQL
ncbi:MAG: hypothetical protein ACLVFN_05685 [Enterocloster sp.]